MATTKTLTLSTLSTKAQRLLKAANKAVREAQTITGHEKAVKALNAAIAGLKGTGEQHLIDQLTTLRNAELAKTRVEHIEKPEIRVYISAYSGDSVNGATFGIVWIDEKARDALAERLVGRPALPMPFGTVTVEEQMQRTPLAVKTLRGWEREVNKSTDGAILALGLAAVNNFGN